jgi:hypothetical protein
VACITQEWDFLSAVYKAKMITVMVYCYILLILKFSGNEYLATKCAMLPEPVIKRSRIKVLVKNKKGKKRKRKREKGSKMKQNNVTLIAGGELTQLSYH